MDRGIILFAWIFGIVIAIGLFRLLGAWMLRINEIISTQAEMQKTMTAIYKELVELNERQKLELDKKVA